MPNYMIHFSGTGSVIVEADNAEEAEAKFMEGEIDFDFADGAEVFLVEEYSPRTPSSQDGGLSDA